MTPNTPQPRQWRLFAALFGALMLSLGAGYVVLLRQDYAILYQDLREDDAAAITRALETQHVRYRLANGGADILVPAADLDQVRLDIAASDVAINGLEGFELFDQSDMGLTDFAQHIKYQRALQGELARTIMRMDGIVDARVHISIPERTLFRADRRNAEAAVTVVTRRAQDMGSARVEGIQRLVAAAVTDLSPGDVVVLDGRGQPLAAAAAALEAAPPPPDPIAEIGALARDAVHRAIPYRRFELRSDALPPELDGALVGDNGNDSLESIAFTLVTEASLTEEERERVEAELARTGLGPAGEDRRIAFDVGPLRPAARVEAASDAAPTASASTPASAATAHAIPPTNWAWLVGAALLVFIIGLIAWRLVRPNLAPTEQRTFAETLATALQQDAGEARDGV